MQWRMKTRMETKRCTKQAPSGLGGALGANFVSMGPEEAVRHAKQHFGVFGQVHRFATEKDDTYRIRTGDGQGFVLKVANPLEDLTDLSLQVKLLEHIRRVDPDIPVPRVQYSSKDNEPIVPIVDAAGQHRYMQLLSYLEGAPLDTIKTTAKHREALGSWLARLRLAMAEFSHPGDARFIAWDVKNLPELSTLLDSIQDADKREALVLGLERFETLMPRIQRLRTQVVHNDFNGSNTIVDANDSDFVTGIIDFGDAVRTAIAIDVSTAMLAQLPRDMHARQAQNMFEASRDLLRGYLQVASLDDEELALLPHLVMGRVIARALITLWRARQMPHNAAYVLRNTEPGWSQLAWFLARDPDVISAVFSN